MPELWVTVNLLSGEMRSHLTSDAATEYAAKTNLENRAHPAFELHHAIGNQCTYEGRWYREFGRSEFFWNKECDSVLAAH